MNTNPVPPGTPQLAPPMHYRIQAARGQVHVGYFLPDPASRELRLVARTQHPNRKVADGKMVNRCRATAKTGVTVVQYPHTPDTGHIVFYPTEQAARDAIVAAYADSQGKVNGVMYTPSGVVI